MKSKSVKQLLNDLKRKNDKVKKLDKEMRGEKAIIARLTRNLSEAKKKEEAARRAKAKAKGKAKPKKKKR
jgi:hypothetical protein